MQTEADTRCRQMGDVVVDAEAQYKIENPENAVVEELSSSEDVDDDDDQDHVYP